jgi:hypothetical protein
MDYIIAVRAGFARLFRRASYLAILGIKNNTGYRIRGPLTHARQINHHFDDASTRRAVGGLDGIPAIRPRHTARPDKGQVESPTKVVPMNCSSATTGLLPPQFVVMAVHDLAHES